MRIFSKILQIVGIAMLFTFGAGMDSPSIVIPLILAFTGIIIAFIGAYIEEAYVWQQ